MTVLNIDLFVKWLNLIRKMSGVDEIDVQTANHEAKCVSALNAERDNALAKYRSTSNSTALKQQTS